MGRPAKSISTNSHHHTKDEELTRQAIESVAKGGNADNLVPPEYLTESQKDIFNYIIAGFKDSGILGNLDIYVLIDGCITIDRLISIEKEINEKPEKRYDTKIMAARDKYSKDFFRCCNELSLSPQARAKLSISAVANIKEKRNPILDILEE